MERDPRLSIYDYLNFSQDQEITALMKPGGNFNIQIIYLREDLFL